MENLLFQLLQWKQGLVLSVPSLVGSSFSRRGLPDAGSWAIASLWFFTVVKMLSHGPRRKAGSCHDLSGQVEIKSQRGGKTCLKPCKVVGDAPKVWRRGLAVGENSEQNSEWTTLKWFEGQGESLEFPGINALEMRMC